MEINHKVLYGFLLGGFIGSFAVTILTNTWKVNPILNSITIIQLLGLFISSIILLHLFAINKK